MTFPACLPKLNIRFNAASSRLIVALAGYLPCRVFSDFLAASQRPDREHLQGLLLCFGERLVLAYAVDIHPHPHVVLDTQQAEDPEQPFRCWQGGIRSLSVHSPNIDNLLHARVLPRSPYSVDALGPMPFPPNLQELKEKVDQRWAESGCTDFGPSDLRYVAVFCEGASEESFRALEMWIRKRHAEAGIETLEPKV